jgi:hypothetical protein
MFGFKAAPNKKDLLSPNPTKNRIHSSQQPMLIPKEPFKGHNPFTKSPGLPKSHHFAIPKSPANPFIENYSSTARQASVPHHDEPPPKRAAISVHAYEERKSCTIKSAANIEDFDFLDLDLIDVKSSLQMTSAASSLVQPQEKSVAKISLIEEDFKDESGLMAVPEATKSATKEGNVLKAYGVTFHHDDFLQRYAAEIEKTNIHIKGIL